MSPALAYVRKAMRARPVSSLEITAPRMFFARPRGILDTPEEADRRRIFEDLARAQSRLENVLDKTKSDKLYEELDMLRSEVSRATEAFYRHSGLMRQRHADTRTLVRRVARQTGVTYAEAESGIVGVFETACFAEPLS